MSAWSTVPDIGDEKIKLGKKKKDIIMNLFQPLKWYNIMIFVNESLLNYSTVSLLSVKLIKSIAQDSLLFLLNESV